jgi:hypothetical protein
MSLNYKELELVDRQIKELKEEVLTKSHPLGNKIYEYTDDRYNPHLYQLLFNWHPDHFQEDEGIRPSLIIGRRGSGKSSYLNNLSHKESVIPVPIKSWDAVDLIEKQVKLILENQDTIDSEKVSSIWHLVFLTLATKCLIQKFPENSSLKSIVDNFPVKNIITKGFSLITTEILDVLRKKYISSDKNNFDLSIISESLGLGCESLAEWEKMLSGIARDADKYVIIMIDNPERLEPTIDKEWEKSYADAGKPRWQTYAGLLTLLAHFNEGKVGVQARYCVSAEQYFFLQDRSSAILKDFSNIQILHWSSGEILSALAHRYMVYLQLHPESRDEERYNQLKGIEIYGRKGAFEFFSYVFEENIKNNRGYIENTVPYLLRHTQLLPRQILLYVNEAIRLAITDNPKYDLTFLDSEYIKKAIENNEELCATEIIDSYRSVFPEGKELMGAIGDIPIICTVASLKRNWAKLGAKKILNKYSSFPEVIVESDRFIRFLIEVGIIGRAEALENPSDGAYIKAVYEYTLPQHLHVKSSEMIAIHPIFSNHTSPERYADLDPYKGVYPQGTEPDAPIDKGAIKNKYIRS